MYVKLSRKGQITIPKRIREQLNIENDGGVLFLVEGNEVKLKGVSGAQANRLAGSLKKYSKGYIPLAEAREEIKGKITNEIAAEGLSD